MSLATDVYKEINANEYKCIVCYNSIGRRSPIWSCNSCYRAFDVTCIRKWRAKELESKSEWRCPHCLITQPEKAIRYKCWCGKVDNPERQDFIDPHSCGQTCGAKRSCPHPCPLPCHTGPHLDSKSCMFEGPSVKCFCGKEKVQTQCAATKYKGFSCGNICKRRNPICGHECPRSCHRRRKGGHSCGPCEVKLTVSCHCGRLRNRVMPCHKITKSARKSAKRSTAPSVLISCESRCEGKYACGVHRCEQRCHSHVTSPPCPYVPSPDESCHCGKSSGKRLLCTDAVSCCAQVCGKTLSCGHQCPEICHAGNCPPCAVLLVGWECACHSTVQDIMCHMRQDIKCDTICKKPLDCNQHICKQMCCPHSRYTAVDTVRKKKEIKQKRGITINLQELGALSAPPALPNPDAIAEDRDVHICIRTCDKLLNCGRHRCQLKCHSGKCNPCTTLLFDEWTCSCGKTVVEPPISCGSAMPRCSHRCSLPQICGHPAQHKCHDNSIACLSCPLLVPVTCRCGKSLVNEVCSYLPKKAIKLCMKECGDKLPCGHICQQLCCPGRGQCPPCSGICGVLHGDCRHPHLALCHYPETCPDLCEKQFTASCPCGVLQVPYTCGEFCEVDCNDICVKESYPLEILSAFRMDKQWFIQVEKLIRKFMADPLESKLHFDIEDKMHRRYQYLMLEHYGIQGEGIQQGNQKYVVGCKSFSSFMASVKLVDATLTRPHVPAFSNPTEARHPIADDRCVDPSVKHGVPSTTLVEENHVEGHNSEGLLEPSEELALLHLSVEKMKVHRNAFSLLSEN